MSRPKEWDEEIARRGAPFPVRTQGDNPPVTGYVPAPRPVIPPRPAAPIPALPAKPDPADRFPATPPKRRVHRAPDLPGALGNTAGIDAQLDPAFPPCRTSAHSNRWCDLRARDRFGIHTGRTPHAHRIYARERLTQALADPSPEAAVVVLRYLAHRPEHETPLTALFGSTAD